MSPEIEVSENTVLENKSSELRIAILTTRTPHHMAYVKAISEVYPNTMVFEEKRDISVGFDTVHEVEELRDRYETETYFNGKLPDFSAFCPYLTFGDLNHPDCVQAIEDFAPDAVFTFGTGRIGGNVVQIRPNRFINVLSADPEQYRGLDTHLWAMYHGDFENLVASLHRVDPDHDQGGVVMKKPVILNRHMKFYELRKATCDACINMSLEALEMLEKFDQFISQPQRYIGRHYSFMPSVLKDRCIQKFYTHILMLDE